MKIMDPSEVQKIYLTRGVQYYNNIFGGKGSLHTL